jgi:uncharacterized protein (TIGR02117 family)
MFGTRFEPVCGTVALAVCRIPAASPTPPAPTLNALAMRPHAATLALALGRRILLLGAALMMSACAAGAGQREALKTSDDAVQIHVVQHGLHTGVVVPRLGSQAPFTLLAPVFGEPTYYEFGWGDRDYYPAENPGIWLGLRALLWPTPSALHVAALSKPPQQAFPESETRSVFVSREGYQQLLRYFAAHFVLTGDSQPLDLGQGQYGSSRFFAAHRSFHLFRTCNTWTAEALQSGGLPVSTFMTLMPANVLRQLGPPRGETPQAQAFSLGH